MLELGILRAANISQPTVCRKTKRRTDGIEGSRKMEEGKSL